MSNLLSAEKSPYLLQHKDNPIAWYPWGEVAFQEAKTEDKPVFLSVGYSTCHWCHVMAHESFESQEVADLLNEHFVSIKLDREERPDIDALYMRAVQALTGGGGWPMSVWLTPEGIPFFAGTYFPKNRLMQISQRIHEIWSSDRSALLKDSQQLLGIIRSMSEEDPQLEGNRWSESEASQFLDSYINHFQDVYDDRFGGFGKAPKFPQTMNLMLMMRQDHKTGLGQAEAMVTGTLENMLRGGVYDQLRGGFHRYSVDEKWLVPHFEKMLYDQALMSLTLLDAHSTYGGVEFERVTRETLDYVLREMRSAEGGFYCAQDADSLDPAAGHMEEGYFATYSFEELKSLLSSSELASLQKVYGVCPEGQYEGRNILHLQAGFDGAAKQDSTLIAALEKLNSLRESRPAPHLDNKIIVAWNGWMIWALAQAARRLNEPRYEQAALNAIQFVREKLWINGQLLRYWCEGEARGQAMAEDYASLIHALLEFSNGSESRGFESWILELQSVLDKKFWDETAGGYFTGLGEDAHLPLRTKDDYDGVHPCANSMGAFNFERLYTLTGKIEFRERAEQIYRNLFPRFREYPSSLPFLGMALDWRVSQGRVAVYGDKGWVSEFAAQSLTRFLPHIYWVRQSSTWPVAQGKTASELYLCEAGQCLAPIKNRETALRMIAASR